MSKQLKIEGIDSKCEFCGNLYASDYLSIHLNQKCRVNPKSYYFKYVRRAENYVENIVNNGSPQNVNSVIEPKVDKKLIRCEHCNVNIRTDRFDRHIKKCPQIHNSKTQNGKKMNHEKRVHQEKNLVQCKHCNSIVPLDKAERHLKSKCRYIRNTNKFVLKQKPRGTEKNRRRLAQETDNPLPIEFEKRKILCSKCGCIYLRKEKFCPECLRIEERNIYLSICSICNIKFSERIFADHYFKCVQRFVSCIECKRRMRIKTFESHTHANKSDITNDQIKFCRYCNAGIKLKNYKKHSSTKCPNLHKNRSSRKGSSRINSLVNSKGCRVCGKPTMHNSGHCYSCGDK